MSAIELLKKQHQEVKKLFGKIEKAREGKEELFEQIADELAVHATIEEKIFYPATKSARTEELLHEAVEEHLAVKRLIADMLKMSPEDEQFDAKVTVLKEQVEHHVEEEEGELFPKVQKMLGKDELEDLGVAMEEMMNDLKAGGAPREAVPAETGSAAPLE
ncbi:MAG TPA: hemerythrin domain-containing protein [Myxococcales bacterium]|nr:hemerythrin domain-containing protein [Myxococcales bacterium]